MGAGGRQFESARPDQWNQADAGASDCLKNPAVDDLVAAGFRQGCRSEAHAGHTSQCFQGFPGRSPAQKAGDWGAPPPEAQDSQRVQVVALSAASSGPPAWRTIKV